MGRSSSLVGHLLDVHDVLPCFKEFLEVDLRQSKKTVYEKTYYVKKFLTSQTKPLSEVTREDLRSYLKNFLEDNCTYKNSLASLKTFFRDYLQKSEVVASFKFPRQPFKPKSIVTREQLVAFYQALTDLKEQALFLLYATSGLRRNEILGLNVQDLDLDNCMIIPNCHTGNTKKSYLSFFNSEALEILKQYLEVRKANNGHSEKLFPFARQTVKKLWSTARLKTGLDITPQRLREFFCMQMSELGVQDRFIDAMCGRTPKSILARNYTDYNPTKLKSIYEKAHLRILDPQPEPQLIQVTA